MERGEGKGEGASHCRSSCCLAYKLACHVAEPLSACCFRQHPRACQPKTPLDRAHPDRTRCPVNRGKRFKCNSWSMQNCLWIVCAHLWSLFAADHCLFFSSSSRLLPTAISNGAVFLYFMSAPPAEKLLEVDWGKSTLPARARSIPLPLWNVYALLSGSVPKVKHTLHQVLRRVDANGVAFLVQSIHILEGVVC